MQSAYNFELIGKEKLEWQGRYACSLPINGHGSASTSNLLKHFTYPIIGERGRIWLDSDDFRIWRWESEATVTGTWISPPLLCICTTRLTTSRAHSECLCRNPSSPPFSTRIKSDKESIHLAGRITYNYAGFKRFSVSTDSEVRSASKDRILFPIPKSEQTPIYGVCS